MVVANPMDVKDDEQKEKNAYGPQAVLKPGVIGNYEPVYPTQKGPGTVR